MASDSSLRLPAGSPLPASIEPRVHEALAILRAKKTALDAGVPPDELDTRGWTVQIERCDSDAA